MSAGTLLLQLAAAQNCRSQLLGVSPATPDGWIDVATPDDACTKNLGGFGATYQLVMSDEFDTLDRDFRCVFGAWEGADATVAECAAQDRRNVAAAADPCHRTLSCLLCRRASAQDKVWTAEDMYYFPTRDEEVYKPEQVAVAGGAAVITMEKGEGTAPSQQPDGTVWDVPKVGLKEGNNEGNRRRRITRQPQLPSAGCLQHLPPSLHSALPAPQEYKSGFMTTWNKFCYTGGWLAGALWDIA